MTFLLTAVEPRVKAAVACVFPITGTMLLKTLFKDLQPDQIRLRLASPQWRVAASSVQNYAHAIGSRPFLMLMGKKDVWYSIAEAQMVFDLIPGPNKELHFYDSGHKLPSEYHQKAIGWFESHLK